MKQVKALIYDCDGVMFESRAANLAFYNRILERFSYPPVESGDETRCHLCHTASSAEVLRNLLCPEHLGAALEFAAAIDYRDFIPQMVPQHYLTEVLSRLSPTYPLAIATNRGKSIMPILEHFDLRQYFTLIVTSHDVARPKPAPDMLLLAAEKLSLRPEDCLFIGDSELDQQAARAAGTQFAGYGAELGGAAVFRSHHDVFDYLP